MKEFKKVKSRPSIDGKFFKLGEKRYYIKGVTYGTFEPDESGDLFPPMETVERDFRLMSENGVNTVRTYTVPPLAVLDTALKYNLKMMIGMPWEQHLTFLDSEKQENEIVDRVRQNIILCSNHPAIFSYAIGNEIPASIVRWYGDKRISLFLKKLYHTVKEVDPKVLVTYVNYPTTEYLDLSFLDFYCFNVFLETEEKLTRYLAKLHNLAEDKPLLLSEIGLDSMRNGLEKQAETLDWQIRKIFEKGCAGCFVFSWTDDWWRGGLPIDDWDFGLVDRCRNSKPALSTVRKVFKELPFKERENLPLISIVVCSYNGSKTIRDTLVGVSRLEYPKYEVIVVNDGSKDNTAEIASQFYVQLISTENRGLSSARNTGLYASKGEIIAYIDDDAYPDPKWLTYLASSYLSTNHAGIGGPNLPPKEAELISHCVANSPGGPCHVLLNDEVAEHIPGCNMSFKRSILIEIGGFDPVFRAAGDDVDICWRIQERGYTIGFHHAAFVWHHRRSSLKMYWKQQEGYGKAEALLEKKWPEKYNSLGHLSWRGHIYGNGLTNPIYPKKRKIFYGSQGSALFQSVYNDSYNSWSSISLMPEWFLIILFFGIVSVFGFELTMFGIAFPIFLFLLGLIFAQSAFSAAKAIKKNKSIPKDQKFKGFLITTYMHFIQPISRLRGRIKHGLNPSRGNISNLRYLKSFSVFPQVIYAWSEKWAELSDWQLDLKRELLKRKMKVKKGGDFDRWDLEYKLGPFISAWALLTVEEHGMGKQYFKIKQRLRLSIIPGLLFIGLFLVTMLAFEFQAYLSLIFFGSLSILLVLKVLADSCYILRFFRVSVETLALKKNAQKEVIEEMSSIRARFENSNIENVLIDSVN